MSELKKVSDARCRDIQTIIRIIGAIITSVGFVAITGPIPWPFGILICYGVAFHLLSRRFDPERVEIRYGGNALSKASQ